MSTSSFNCGKKTDDINIESQTIQQIQQSAAQPDENQQQAAQAY